MPKIEIANDSLDGVKNVVQVSRDDHSFTFKGDPGVLRRIVFWAGDAIWPDWFETQLGKKTYLGYAEQCSDGEVSWHGRMFNPVWPRIQKHLQVDGIIIAMVPK